MKLTELRARTTNPATGCAYTGEQMARACNVTAATYFRWEWGTSVPNSLNLLKLDEVLPGARFAFTEKIAPA